MIEIIIIGIVLILCLIGFLLFSWKFWMHKREKDKAKELLKQIESSEDRFATINDDYYYSFWDRYDIGWKIRRNLPFLIFISLIVLFVIYNPLQIGLTSSNQTAPIKLLNSSNNTSINYAVESANGFLSKTFPEGIPMWFWVLVIGLPAWMFWKVISRRTIL
jgi:hypothetical protein